MRGYRWFVAFDTDDTSGSEFEVTMTGDDGD